MFRRWQQHSMESAHHSLPRPDCNNTFTLPTALQSHLFLICVALTCNDSRIITRKTCQFPRNCQCKWLFGFLVGSRNFIRLFWVSWEVFVYMCRIVTTALPNLVPPRHIDDCYAIHFLHWEFCDLLLSSHQHFPLWARLYQLVFCKKPSLFLSSCTYRNLGSSECACGHCAYPNPVPLLLATPKVIHEKNWQCLDPQAQGFPVAPQDNVHRPKTLWNPAASPASHAIDRFVLLCVHFYFCFQFLSVYAAGFPVAPNSYFHFFLVLRCPCLTSNTESCDEDDDAVGVGVVEELLVRCGFWPLVQW